VISVTIQTKHQRKVRVEVAATPENEQLTSALLEQTPGKLTATVNHKNFL